MLGEGRERLQSTVSDTCRRGGMGRVLEENPGAASHCPGGSPRAFPERYMIEFLKENREFAQ